MPYRSIILDNLGLDISLVVVLFVISAIALLCFNLLSAKSLKKTDQNLCEHQLLFFTMSFAQIN
ncbi:hypothetical protein LDG_6152 [Legionella drancourtii LLAP12]|uniref:Uncharacterized protein n=1 Tax=Legionella drancourtii LLAP12 TaxID=658187 RepID=G9EL93_9GAMM|nr:hypothetical protein LDG_6152 [Legionella drancourtii LLAP12]